MGGEVYSGLQRKMRNIKHSHSIYSAPLFGEKKAEKLVSRDYFLPGCRCRANILHRRMWTNVRSHYCITTIHQKDNTSTTSPSQFSAQGRDCSNTRLDSKVPHAGRVGEEKAAVICLHNQFHDLRLLDSINLGKTYVNMYRCKIVASTMLRDR